MRYLLDSLDEIRVAIEKSVKFCVMLDYDGTLAAIASTPGEARLPQSMREILQNLVRSPKILVVIISGRSLGDLRSMVGLQRVYYAGNHGFEVEGPDVKFVHDGVLLSRKVIREVLAGLRKSLGSVEGMLIEDKDITISVHYRLVRESEIQRLKTSFSRLVVDYDGITVTEGKMVLEVRPRIEWDKGKASLFILEQIGNPNPVLYIGDDSTDEDAFRALTRAYSVVVLNGRSDSSAGYFLRRQDEVEVFLKWIVENLDKET